MKSAQCRLHVHIITFALSITNKFLGQLINPRHMREGYGTRSVCVTKLAPTYLVCESKVQYYKVPCGVPNACIVWISLKPLCLPVLVSFADAKLLVL